MYTYNLGLKFKEVASQNSESNALLTDGAAVSYRELDENSDLLAAHFLESGLSSGDVICISGEKTVRAIECILAALKAGVTYSVFDPESPIARLEKVFDCCKPSLILCSSAIKEKFANSRFQFVDYSFLPSRFTPACALSIERHIRSLTASTPAYIMFTSGSTGVPKGAVMTHQNVLNLISWSHETYSFQPTDVLTSVNPLFFDNSVFDLYSSLFAGAALALFDANTVRDPGKLLKLIEQFKCTSWFSVPSMLIYLQTVRALKAESFGALRRIIFGGEGYPKAKLKQLFDLYCERIDFYNVYGPTECTCICSSYHVSKEDFADLKGFLPLGTLAPNFNGLIVDEDLREVNPGEIGELLLQGPNVGLGYFRDTERTRASFVQNPINTKFSEIVYRTGDLVFLDQNDGKIWIVGRADNQIKHMGYRIELEEVENALSCLRSVEQSAVIHCEIRGLSQIVAFVRSKDNSVDELSLRDDLARLIPHYMIPTKFVFLSQLPRNANGKLDRKTLKSDYMEQMVNG